MSLGEENKKKKKKRAGGGALLVSLLHGGQETRGLVEANRMQMLVVWEKGCGEKRSKADEGMGG